MRRAFTACDRCGKDVKSSGSTIKVPQERDYHDKSLDLCSKCYGEFQTWLKNKPSRLRGVPRGYKQVARPCPHQIPCADPHGCSGTELVPLSDPREGV